LQPSAQWIITIQEEQLLWTAVQDKRSPESTSTGPGPKELPAHKEIVIRVIPEAGKTATTVVEIRARRVIETAVIHLTTDNPIQDLVIQDITIRDSENPAITTTDLGNNVNLTTISLYLQIDHSALDRNKVDTETVIITHQESGLLSRIITHTSKGQAPVTTRSWVSEICLLQVQ